MLKCIMTPLTGAEHRKGSRAAKERGKVSFKPENLRNLQDI